MPITFINAWTEVNATSINTSTGNQAQVGDLLFFWASSGSANPNITGFTNVVPSFIGSGPNSTVSYKIAGVGDIGATFNTNNNLNVASGIIAFRGVNQTTPIDAAGTGSTGSSASPAAASITLTNSGDALLWCCAANPTANPLVMPAGYSTAFSVAGVGGTNYTSGVGYILGTPSGATGTVTGTITSTAWNAVLVGLSAQGISVAYNYTEEWSTDY